jgi:type I restriction enzyme M protein
MAIHQPSWFSKSKVMVSTAPTCGLTKGGRLLPKIDPTCGKRIQVTDPETKELVDAVDDELLTDMQKLQAHEETETLRFVPAEDVSLRCAVPVYYDRRYHEKFRAAMLTDRFAGFSSSTLGELFKTGVVEIRGGHGSPSHDERVGEVPYIKVSDLRAGLININPTNRVPFSVARQYWRGESSGLRPFDLACPERTSKNIGDFCILMPGQEQVVMTREIIILRAGPEAPFDQFYLLWAMTLNIVRDQWKRIVFMQTNREDVGGRFLEIEIPVPATRAVADSVSAPFRDYYLAMAHARTSLADYLRSVPDHHFFVSGVDEVKAEAGIEAEQPIRESAVFELPAKVV